MTTWAILVAHAARPSNHFAAQSNAQALLDDLGADKQLTDYHPCIVLGVPDARRYFIGKGYIRLLHPFAPRCVLHQGNYDICSPSCVYGVALGDQWVHELVGQWEADPGAKESPESIIAVNTVNALREQKADSSSSATKVGATFRSPSPPDNVQFLRAMEAEALALADAIGSPDHWAKPYYSSTATLQPRITRAFVGLNGAGNRSAHEYDLEDGNADRPWTDPTYNAILDDRWGDEHGASPAGTAALQRAIQAIFEAMYGVEWKAALRGTACLNIMPVSSRGQDDPFLKGHWESGIGWGLRLIEHLNPALLILNGNGAKGSAWSALNAEFGIREVVPAVQLENPYFRLRDGELTRGSLAGSRVIGLPHLSRNKASPALRQALVERGKQQPFP